jgi:hypothetical protein
LKASVVIQLISKCSYLLRLEDSILPERDNYDLNDLNSFGVIFKINSDGEIDSILEFESGDKQWSRNIKRSIISMFQIRTKKSLQSWNHLENFENKTILYETDFIGKCLTTYSLSEYEEILTINKNKNLLDCVLNKNLKSSKFYSVSYYTCKYFVRLFYNFEFNFKHKSELISSKATIKNGIINALNMDQQIEFIGSIVSIQTNFDFNQNKTHFNSDEIEYEKEKQSYESHSIEFELSDNEINDNEDFDLKEYMSELCDSNTLEQDIASKSSKNFKSLVRQIHQQNTSTLDLIKIIKNPEINKCKIARLY